MKKTTEKYGWVNENGGKSAVKFDSKTDAARDGINKNPGKSNYVYVVSASGKYIGGAEGINFNG
jgi:hypothetical protein